MTQGAAEGVSELLVRGVSAERDVSGQSMLDPDSQNKPMGAGCAGGADQETGLLSCSWGTALGTRLFFSSPFPITSAQNGSNHFSL